jgi:hypothetical protein
MFIFVEHNLIFYFTSPCRSFLFRWVYVRDSNVIRRYKYETSFAIQSHAS